MTAADNVALLADQLPSMTRNLRRLLDAADARVEAAKASDDPPSRDRIDALEAVTLAVRGLLIDFEVRHEMVDIS